MKTLILFFLTSLLASNTFVSQSTQEPPELKAASELTKSVVKLFKEEKSTVGAALRGRPSVE